MDGLDSNTLILLAGALVIVSLIALIALLRAMRLQRQQKATNTNKSKKGNARTQSNPDWQDVDWQYRAMQARRRGRGALLWFFLVLPIAIGIIAAALWDWQQIDFGASWPVQAATINSVSAEPNYRADGSIIREEHTIVAPYIYTVEGSFHSGTLQFVAYSSAERQQYLNEYTIGREIPVWHHPVFHQIHFTQSQFPDGFGRIYNLIALGVGAFFALIAAFMLNSALGAFAEAGRASRG